MREQVGELPYKRIHLLIKQRQVGLAASHYVFGLGELIFRHRLAVHDFAVVDISVGTNQRIAQPPAVLFQHRHHLRDKAFDLHLVGAPHLTRNAIVESVFHRQEPRQKIRRAAVGRRAVFRAGLAIDRKIRGNGEIGGHTDLLPAGDAHAVDAADHGFLTVKDSVHHGVEQIHVFAVLIRPARVIRRVLSGIAAGTECFVADRGEYNCYDASVGGGFLKAGDDSLHHLGSVGVILRGVVERDPSGIETVGRLAVFVPYRTFLVNDARRVFAEMTVVEELVVLQFIVFA